MTRFKQNKAPIWESSQLWQLYWFKVNDHMFICSNVHDLNLENYGYFSTKETFDTFTSNSAPKLILRMSCF